MVVQYKAGVDNGNWTGIKYDNFLNFMEFYRPKLGSEADTRPQSYWGKNDDILSGYDLSAISNASETGVVNLTNYLQWCYDDYWGRNTYHTGGHDNAYSNNVNVIKIRVSTDGAYAYLYINPNPNGLGSLNNSDGTTGSYPNEFLLVAKESISYSNNLIAMFGVEANRSDQQFNNAAVSNFTIRSVCSSVTSEIAPYQVKANSTTRLYTVITPVFSSANEAGVGEFYVDMPAGYAWTNEFTNSISIQWIDTNGTAVKTFGKSYGGDANPAAGNVRIIVKDLSSGDKRRLKVRFNSSEVFHPDNGCGTAATNAILLIVSNFTSAAIADSSGKSFTIYVNNEKYNDTAWTKVATTGKMQSYAGDAYNMVLLGQADNNTLAFRTYNDPYGVAGLSAGITPTSPYPFMYEGDINQTLSYTISAKDATNNNADIGRVVIIVPDGFTINSNTMASLRIDPSNISLSNNSGKQYIVVDYSKAGTALVAGSGIDTISFQNNTTTNFLTNEVMVFWKSLSYSALAGTSFVTNSTNSEIIYQQLLVRKKPPNGDGYIAVSPNVIPALTKNTAVSNNYSYVIQNLGDNGNNIRKALINLGNYFTNAVNVTNSIPAVSSIYSSNSSVWIEVNYAASGKVLSNNNIDTISFTAYDNVQPLTNVILVGSNTSYADNGNGDGWVPLNRDSLGWEVSFYTPPAELRARIIFPEDEYGGPNPFNRHEEYTDIDFGTNIQIEVKNWGEAGNDISLVKIICPFEITNILSLNSLNGAFLSTNKENGSNVIIASYAGMGNLKASLTDPSFGSNDIINLNVLDSITQAMDVSFTVQGKNTTNYADSSPLEGGNLIMNYIYPPVMADSFVSVSNGFIDAATNTATITYTINNLGRYGNRIIQAFVYFPTNYITNIQFNGSLLGAAANYSSGVLTLSYGNKFPGGTNDVINVTMWDNVESAKTTFDLTCGITNDRELSNSIGVTSNQTQTVYITPPPTLYSYRLLPTIFYNAKIGATNTNQLVISVSNRGWGSNKLNRIKIDIPQDFINEVTLVSNALTGLINTSSGPLQISNNNNIWLMYDQAGTNLTAGGRDDIYLWIEVSSTNVTNTTWTVWAANNSTNDYSQSLTNNGFMLDGGMNMLSLVDRPHGYTATTEVLTPSVVNAYTNRIKNGDTINSGRSISRVRIGMLSMFTLVSNIMSSSLGACTTNGNYIIVNYGVPLSPGSLDTIVYYAYDNWTFGETRESFTWDVDYGDGSGWHPAGTTPGQTNEVYFRNPTVSARTYVTPNQVSQDFPTNNYSFYLENIGESGNNIAVARITAPNFITNISNAVSLIKSGIITITSNIVTIYYTNSLLASTETDLISLIGYDSISNSTTNDNWQLYVYNTTNFTGGENAIIVVGKSLGLNIVAPDVRPRIYIEATNSVSDQEKNVIYSSLTTNYLKFYIYNLSPTEDSLDDSITKLKITLPMGGILDTNTLSATNLIISNAVTILSNGALWVDYSSSRILSGQHDEILIRVNDTITHSETNLTWSADAAFVSTYNNYKNAALYSSDKSLSITYRMPQPAGYITMNPSQLYQNQTNFVMHLSLSNSGMGTADLDYLWVTLPNELKTGFDLTKISNTKAIATNYNSGTGQIEFYYSSPLLTGQQDDIYLSLNNASAVSTNLYIDSKVRDFIYTNTTSIETNKNLFISTYPAVSVTPNVIDTTTSTNLLTITLDNIINGTLNVKKAILVLPEEFTNIISIQSRIITNAAHITGTATNLVLNYDDEGKEIEVGDYDVITVNLADNFNVGTITNGLLAYVSDGQGFGFVQTKVRVSGSTNIIFQMPQPVSQSRLYPDTISLTTTTNSMSIWITNEGSGSSAIRFARIWLPSGLSNVSPAITSSNIGLTAYIPESNLIFVQYTNENLLSSGKEDCLSFIFTNRINSVSNLSVLVEVANLTNNPQYVNSPGVIGPNLMIRVDYPPVAAEGYFNNSNTLYIIQTNSSLTYRIMNRTFDTVLTQAVITLDTNLFTGISVASLKALSSSFNSASNQITFSYDPLQTNFGFSGYDDITFNFKYSLSNSYLIPVHTRVWLTGNTITNIDTLASAGNVSYILITNSSWGAVRGTIFPSIKPVNVKLYYPGTSTAATNVDGAVITAVSSGTGIYDIDKVPAGTYNFEYTAATYRTYRINNFKVNANTLNIISIITMDNAPLIAGLTNSNQEVDCYDDNRSKVIFLTNGIEKQFAVNIKRMPFTEIQKEKVNSENLIKEPSTKDYLSNYMFDLSDINDNQLKGAIITNDAIMYLAYDVTNITSRGWNENDLAIYYWDETKLNSRWIRLGGEVDKVNQFVIAKVNYIHQFYAVMAKSGDGKSNGAIRNVSVRPKIFTPTKDQNGYFGSVRISFELDPAQKYDSYEVKIYDLRGDLVKSFKRSGSYTQGEVAWDSRDDGGYPVKGGVYIYRVKAGTSVFAGTIIIVR